jgi:hypothetical protein
MKMKRISGIFLGLGLALGTAALFGRAPDAPNQEKSDVPKAERKKGGKRESDHKSGRKEDKSNGKQTNQKRKAEQPKAQ